MRRLLSPLLLLLLLSWAWPAIFAQDEAKRARRHYEQGQRLYRKGYTGQAIEELYTALSIREIYLEAQLLLARALVAAERPREAFGTLRSVDLPYWQTAEVQKLFGQAFYQMNKLAEAERALQSAMQLATRPDPELHYLLGLVKLRRGEAPGAVSEAQRALALNSHFALARKLLSDAYLARGEARQAEQELTRYLRTVHYKTEAQYLKQRLAAIRSIARAQEEPSEETVFTKPQIHKLPQPGYTAEARQNRIEGTVRTEVLFGSDGRVQQVIVVQGLGFGLDEAAVRAAQEISFTPGQLNEKPISVWGGVRFIFAFPDPVKEPRPKAGDGHIAARAIRD